MAQAILKKIEKIEQQLAQLQQPKNILGKLKVDSKTIQKASKAIFDFDIEKFVTKKDLKAWKK
jgi:hypothetical protein